MAEALERAAVFDPTIRFGDVGSVSLLPLLQARWTYVESPQSTPRSVEGFSVPRTRLAIVTEFLDCLSFKLRFGARSDGNVRAEEAFGQARWKEFRLRAGQLPLKLNLGEEPTPQGLSSADYSAYASVFAGGQTQGAQLRYDGPVRLIGTVGNGARSGFSELLSPLVADLATTGRIEVPIGSPRSEDLDSEVSFRRGQRVTARLGTIGHFQTRSATPSNPSLNAGLAGGDVVVRGSGFSMLASFSYLRLDPGDGPGVEDVGVMFLGSVLAARRVELFGQFDAIWPLGARAPHPTGFADGQPGTTPFRTMTLGTSYFIVPDVNRAKLQLDLQTMFDGETSSLLPPNTPLGILASPGPQIALRLQLVMAL